MENGDVVKINYIGRIKGSGEIFDLTDQETAEKEDVDTSNMNLGPVSVLLGENYVISGLEEEIEKMEEGEEKTVTVPKERAFGSRRSENIKTISEKEFDKYDVTPRRGLPVEIDGRRGKVLTVSNGRVKVDFNHPLAGRDLEYEIEVIEKVEETKDQVEAVLDYHLDDEYSVEVDGEEVEVEIENSFPEDIAERLEEEIKKLDSVDSAKVEASEEEDEGEEKSG